MNTSVGSQETRRYRASCDRCQAIKVRCSQDKPTCRRCQSKGIQCVYSPFRRIGRPKKHSTCVSESLESPITGNPVNSAPQAEERRSVTGDVAGQPAPTSRNAGDSSTATWIPHMIDPVLNESSNAAIRRVTRAQDIPSHNHAPTSDNGNYSSLPPDLGPPHHRLTVTNDDDNTEFSSRGLIPRHHPTSFQDPSTVASSSTRLGAACGQVDCYVAVLTRAAELEKSLLVDPRTAGSLPRLQVVFEAARDVQALKRRLFSCCGSHEAPPTDPRCQRDPTSAPEPCLLDPRRPVALSLILLFERVVGLLEQEASVVPPLDDASPTARPPGHSAPNMPGRLELELRIGDYAVADERAKERLVGRLIQLQVRRLAAALHDTRLMLQGRLGGLKFGSTNSDLALVHATCIMMEGLTSRVESLQRRVASNC
ncbi:hypothetical protein F4778DRAFT_186496 [Xylariomycetidae sp. FL2044]|nr:hypothetical protein F4778DRAFT_186496 [Xylariomycetidae sp. FL2044]